MTALADLRAAFRSLSASRGIVAVAVLTLGAGLSLCLTVLAAVHAYLVRSLPYPEADRLYRVDYTAPGQDGPGFRAVYDLDWHALDDLVEVPIAWDLDVFYVLGARSAGGRGGTAYPESLPGAWVTPGYVDGFGVRAAIGRAFEPRDFVPGSPPVALISDRVWRTRFQSDPSIVGRTFNAYVSDRPEEAETFMIVGVLPPDVWHFNSYTEVLAPLRAGTYPYYVRLRAGVSGQAFEERLAAFVRGAVPGLPAEWRPVVTGMQAFHVAAIRPMLWSVGAGAALVLLIAGANVAVLLLVRGTRRQGELAVRRALGASDGRLVRLLAFEGLLIGVAATAAGLAGSRALVRAVAPAAANFLNRRPPGGSEAFALDPAWLTAALVASLGIVLLFSLAPLLPLRTARLSPMFSAARAATEPRGLRRARSVLIGLEVASSLALISGAALMIDSAQRMLRVDFGMSADRVVTTGISLRQRTYPDERAQADFFERLTERLSGIGGSRSVAVGNWWPLQPGPSAELLGSGVGTAAVDASVIAVTGSYFDTLGMSLIDGRTFDAGDAGRSEPVAIVSESLARHLWPGTSAVGQMLRIGGSDQSGPGTVRRVVGLVGDVRQAHADDRLADAYVPLLQQPGRFAFVYLDDPRSPTWLDELRAAAGALDPEVAVGTPRSLGESLDEARARPRFLAWLLSVFAAFACVLALVGMHGVITYAVRQRQREVAIRIAIGASAQAVTLLFLRQGLVVLAGGLAAGVAAAFGLGRLLESYLFGVQPVEPALVAAAAAGFGLAGLAAIWWPAWRAASTSPSDVLKDG